MLSQQPNSFNQREDEMAHLSETDEALGLSMRLIGGALLEMRHQDLGVETKEAHWDIVTAADKYAEEQLTKWVRENYPDDGVLGEEGASIEGRSGYVWVFDPVDGTTNFERGSDFWGISAGRLKDGQPDFGMVFYPASWKLAIASAGKGAVCHEPHIVGDYDPPVPLGPARWVRPPAASLRQALVIADFCPKDSGVYPLIREKVRNAVTYGSMVFEMLQLAEGKVDAVFHTGATPFDIAAGIVIAQEAGCTVSHIFDNKIDLLDPKAKIPVVMARSKALHDELKQFLQTILA